MSVLPADSLDRRLRERIFLPLEALRRRCRLYLLIDGAVRFILAVLAAGLVQLLLDWWLKLAVDQRAVLNALVTILWAAMFYRHILTPLIRPLSDRALAVAVDRAHPDAHDLLAAAVQFARGEVGAPEANSPQLVRAALIDACETAARVSFDAVLDHRRARRRAVELVVLLVVGAAPLLIMPDLMGVWFRRNWLLRDLPWPRQTHITPIGFGPGGVRRMPRGEEARIAALNSGRVPHVVTLHWWTATDRRDDKPMRRIGDNRWEASLGVLTEDVRFRIVGGDERTREYTVVAIDRPRVIETNVCLTPPEYTGLGPTNLQQQTVLDVPVGSTLAIDARLNVPVVSARFVGVSGEVAACRLVAPDRVQVEWDQPASGAYSFELIDRDGWENHRPVRYTIRVVPDSPPTVSLDLPSVGESITPSAELPLRISAEDSYGLGGIVLRVTRGDTPPLDVTPDGFEVGQRKFAAETTFAVSTLAVAPNDRLRLVVEAWDRDPSGPNVARSQPVELHVVTPPDLLAELAARELELRRDFERLISAQRGVGDALERLLPELPDAGPVSPAVVQRLAGLARRQDSHARSCLAIRRQFEEILAEMRINKVARAGDERRVGQRIAVPLERLGTQMMPAASARISGLRHEASAEVVEALPVSQAEILREMRAVLANMLEWEGFREAVALLQEIIDAQNEVREETINSLERELEDILDLEDSPAREPKP